MTVLVCWFWFAGFGFWIGAWSLPWLTGEAQGGILFD
jgi:hypothetical protein